uniref:Uncharacterized protein n=1 Tax=Arundo donax TaxID=35708 RepID=A0A0A9BRC8_ARUDO
MVGRLHIDLVPMQRLQLRLLLSGPGWHARRRRRP